MSSTTAVKNSMADAWAALGNIYSLHTGDPGAAGTDNEAVGGGYARQPTTWGSASGGLVTGSQITFDVDAGTYTHVARWDNAGTTYLGTIDSPDVDVSPAGEVKMTPTYQYPVSAD